jgi:hypothetical protein
MTTEPLTEREQQALEQMREAQEQGSTLKDYATKIGLDVQQLYDLRRRLVRKGVMTHTWTLPVCEAIVGSGIEAGVQPYIRTLCATDGRGS